MRNNGKEFLRRTRGQTGKGCSIKVQENKKRGGTAHNSSKINLYQKAGYLVLTEHEEGKIFQQIC